MPPAIRIVESASASERIEAARAFVEQHSPGCEILIVSASRNAADDLARLIAARRGATFGLRRYSLAQLAALLALAAAGKQTAPTTPLGSAAIAARVGYQTLRDGALRCYGPVVPFPGFPAALAATMSELRLAGVAADVLEPAAQGDVSEFLRRFNDQLVDSRVHDLAALLRAAADVAVANPPHPLVGRPVVLLDISIDSAAHESFVGALLKRAPAALITVPTGDEASRRALTTFVPVPGSAPVDAHEPELHASPVQDPDLARDPPPTEAHETGLEHDPLATTRNELARLRRYLFFPEPPPTDVRRGDVALLSAPGEGRECIEIARRVLEEATNGVPFDRMAVLLRDPATYTRLLETALGRARIPAYFAQGTLRPDPAGRAFLMLLDCALERFSAKRFAEYLAFGQVPASGAHPPATDQLDSWAPSEDETLGPAAPPAPARGPGTDDDTDAIAVADTRSPHAEPPHPADDGIPGEPAHEEDDTPPYAGLRAPRKWEQLLVESAVVGGLDRWRRRLDGLAAEMRLKIRALTRDPADSARAAALQRDLRHLEGLRAFALPIIESLAALPEHATWGEWLPVLEALAPRVLRRPDRVRAVLAGLRPLGPVGPVGLSEVRTVLAPPLANLERPQPPHRYGRLFVGTVEQARGRAFEVVFAPGLAERGFPQRLREDPILLDDAREMLRLPLRTQRDRSDRERLLLRLVAGSATQRLYLSYPRLDVDKGRPRVASFYALEVERALTGDIPDPETLARTAADASQARLAWPAPDTPTYAIDDFEHDLATLRVLLAGPRDAVRGRARYLFDLNDCLARALRARWRRWRPRWTPADGLVRSTAEIRPALDAARLTARAYSVGILQHFAECPYRFLLLGIHRLKPRDDPAPLEHLDPVMRGALAHDVQARVMRSLQRDGLLPLGAERAAAALSRLDAALAEVAAEYREQLAPAIPRVWESAIEALRVDLRRWLELCIEAHATWNPVAFELAFGISPDELAGLDPQSTPREVVVDGGYRIRGIADLVERRRDSAALRVTDHKTGKARPPQRIVVWGGRALQPVLYALAVQDVLGAPVVEARLFYCTRHGNFEERVVRIAGTDAASRAREALATVDNAIARGFLPPAPLPGACQRCDVRQVCGSHEERRVQRKAQEPLADLHRIRALP